MRKPVQENGSQFRYNNEARSIDRIIKVWTIDMKKIGNICKTYNLFLRVWLLIIPVCLWTGREIYGQTISTIAGGNIGDGELAINASLNFPTSVFVSNSGAILIADYEFSRIREIDSSGIITTIAGNEP